jgi:hypothetical protein
MSKIHAKGLSLTDVKIDSKVLSLNSLKMSEVNVSVTIFISPKTTSLMPCWYTQPSPEYQRRLRHVFPTLIAGDQRRDASVRVNAWKASRR